MPFNGAGEMLRLRGRQMSMTFFSLTAHSTDNH